jgi:hypothetical protein
MTAPLATPVLCAFLSVLAVSAAPASAQAQEVVLGTQLEQQRFDELAKWLRQYYAWEEWFEQWGNRVAHNFNDQPIWERKKRPEPPDWLEEDCQGFLGANPLLDTACYILRHWDEQPLQILQRRHSSLVRSGGKVDDKVVKTSFFQRVHLTGLWTRAQYPATQLYGIVGMQISVFELGRYTLPAVGVMLVMVPDGDGGHDWKPATTVGVGVRICDFVTPFVRKQASLHVNVARTSIHGVRDERVLPAMSVNFIGFSISGKRRR